MRGFYRVIAAVFEHVKFHVPVAKHRVNLMEKPPGWQGFRPGKNARHKFSWGTAPWRKRTQSGEIARRTQQKLRARGFGHTYFKPSDFTAEEYERNNVLAIAVIDEVRLRICKRCGDEECGRQTVPCGANHREH